MNVFEPAAVEVDEPTGPVATADALRALAALIESGDLQESAPTVEYAASYLSGPITDTDARRSPARRQLAEFRAAAEAHGAVVKVENTVSACTVAASWGPLTMRLYASAHLMADQPEPPEYTPLDVEPSPVEAAERPSPSPRHADTEGKAAAESSELSELDGAR